MKWAALVCVALSLPAAAQELDGSHQLSIATKKAVIACTAIGASSIQECGGWIGKSPAIQEAHRTVREAHEAMFAFMQSCKLGEARCDWLADGLVIAGMSQANN